MAKEGTWQKGGRAKLNSESLGKILQWRRKEVNAWDTRGKGGGGKSWQERKRNTNPTQKKKPTEIEISLREGK